MYRQLAAASVLFGLSGAALAESPSEIKWTLGANETTTVYASSAAKGDAPVLRVCNASSSKLSVTVTPAGPRAPTAVRLLPGRCAFMSEPMLHAIAGSPDDADVAAVLNAAETRKTQATELAENYLRESGEKLKAIPNPTENENLMIKMFLERANAFENQVAAPAPALAPSAYLTAEIVPR